MKKIFLISIASCSIFFLNGENSFAKEKNDSYSFVTAVGSNSSEARSNLYRVAAQNNMSVVNVTQIRNKDGSVMVTGKMKNR